MCWWAWMMIAYTVAVVCCVEKVDYMAKNRPMALLLGMNSHKGQGYEEGTNMRLVLIFVLLGMGTGLWGSDHYHFDDELTDKYIKSAQAHRLTEEQAEYLKAYVEVHAPSEGMDVDTLKEKIDRARQDSLIFSGLIERK